MKIQQHDGVVVEATVISVGLRQAQGDKGVSREGEGEARGLGAAALPPPLYIGPLGGAGPRRLNLQGGRRPRGWSAPQAKWGAPTPRVSNPRRRGGPWGRGALAHLGLVPLPLQPMGPSEIGGPTRWTPGTLPVVPVQYRLPPKLS